MIESLKNLVKALLGKRGLFLLDRLLVRGHFVRRYGVRFYRMSRFKWVEGFLLDEEAVQLYRLAVAVPDKDSVVVEIGSWLGKSTIVLGNALVGKTGATLACIDPFDASGDQRSAGRYQSDAKRLNSSIREAFEKNLNRAGVRRVVEIFQGYSSQVAERWAKPVDMLFIDGNHAFEAVRDDFLMWSRFVKAGGIVAFHDTYFEPVEGAESYHAGPGLVIKQYALPDPTWQRVCHIGSLFVLRKSS